MSFFASLYPSFNQQFPFQLPSLDWEVLDGTGEETEIGEFVVIEEGVQIGKNCLIRSHVLLRKGTVIGDNCVIGHGSEIKNAYICDEAKVGSHCFVGDSIIGKGARIGSGTITGNRRFDQKPIDWFTSEGKVASGKDKLGLLLGDYARLGANVTTNPGIVVGPKTWVSGGEVISNYLPENVFVKIGGEVVNNTSATKLSLHDMNGQK